MVRFGIDNIVKINPAWKNENIGLITNAAATNAQLVPSRKLLKDLDFNIKKLFSPEHGLDLHGVDGAKMDDFVDVLTQLPIISLYGNKVMPSADDLNDIDLLLFDIPDVGCRYYTYLWTMTYALEACKKYHKKMIVLDRPNPISGFLPLSEGPILDEQTCSSFIGRWGIPLKHGCTIGELALYFNETKKIHADLEIVKCSFWNREMMQPDWGMQFVPTSPAIQNFEAAILYPGLGLLEATNISEGRGTALPFQQVGAPWMDGNKIAEAFNGFGIDNLDLKPVRFIPTENKYKNESCNGVKFRVTHYPSYLPIFTTLLFIKLVKDIYPQHFKWMPYPTHVNPSGNNHLDKLLGIEKSEALFNLPMLAFLQKIELFTNSSEWQKAIEPFLLY